MEPPHVTMREVAARCGVSQPTVSLCLNHSPLVSETTRRRVCTIAEEMGYRKHPLVAAHMRYRRKPQHAASRPLLALVNAQGTAAGWRRAQASVLRQMLALVQATLHDLMELSLNPIASRRQQEQSRPPDETTAYGYR